MRGDGNGSVVLETQLAALGNKRKGKVRDLYDLGDQMLLVATDRISAFDVVLPDGIPGKGYVLTQLSKFWFAWLGSMADPVSHHFLEDDVGAFPEPCRRFKAVLSGRSMLVLKCRPLPVECIVRGYLSGSGWKEYREQGTVGGQRLAAGLKESDRLPEPIFTPSTKAEQGHDVNIPFSEAEKLLGKKTADQVRKASIRIYTLASSLAEERGIIIADTKFEFGIHPKTDEIVLIDEVLTPDSSRFWPKQSYTPGGGQPSFDKQFVRDYLDSISWDRKPPAPHLPEEIIQKTSRKYFQALDQLTAR